MRSNGGSEPTKSTWKNLRIMTERKAIQVRHTVRSIVKPRPASVRSAFAVWLGLAGISLQALFLIDRGGYVRALWLPQETAAWEDVRSLAALVGQLAKRPLAPYSAGHGH
jgi:hypothetical protein